METSVHHLGFEVCAGVCQWAQAAGKQHGATEPLEHKRPSESAGGDKAEKRKPMDGGVGGQPLQSPLKSITMSKKFGLASQAAAHQAGEPSLCLLPNRLAPREQPCMQVLEQPLSLAMLKNRGWTSPQGREWQGLSQKAAPARGHVAVCAPALADLEFHPLLNFPPGCKHRTPTCTPFIHSL